MSALRVKPSGTPPGCGQEVIGVKAPVSIVIDAFGPNVVNELPSSLHQRKEAEAVPGNASAAAAAASVARRRALFFAADAPIALLCMKVRWAGESKRNPRLGRFYGDYRVHHPW